MSDIDRTVGKNALKTVFSRYTAIENAIFEHSTTDTEYKNTIYQSVGDHINGKSTKDIIKDIKGKLTGWNQPCYESNRVKREEQDNFIEHPFEVEEGVLTCHNTLNDGTTCNSKRVFYYQIQTRSSDEPMTTFANCCACGHKWSYSG